MEQSQPPPTNSTPSPSTSTPQPPEQPQPQPPPSSTTTTTTTTTTTSQPVTLNPTKPTTTAATSAQQQNPTLQSPQQTTTRQPQTFNNNNNRPWQQQQQQQQPSPFQHFSLPPPPPPPPPHSSSSSSSSTSVSVQNPRGGGGGGGMAMGVPAHHPSSSFSSLTPPSFGQQFGGPTSNTTSQVRQPIQGMHGMGMMGSLGSTSPMRGPAGVPPQQLRPVPSSLRPQTSISSQSPATQNFQGHGMLRVQSVGFPSSQSHTTTTSQSPRSLNQPWLSSGGPGKPPLPTTPSLRPQISPQSLHQSRSHIHSPHQQHTVTTTTSSAQQSQPSTLSQSHDHLGPQMPPSRIQQSVSNQALGRGPGLGIQRPSSSHALMQSTAVQPGPPSRAATTLEVGDPCTRILSKRSIQEIVTQIDPSEKLDAEVEDILVDIAEEFVESITTFGCSLAKHRKSNTLEPKDILLHLERNWNMTLPGFGGDEIRTYKKPFTSDIHKERIAAIKKSALAAETTNAKGSGQAGGNMKSHLAKGAANILGSPPNAKT